MSARGQAWGRQTSQASASSKANSPEPHRGTTGSGGARHSRESVASRQTRGIHKAGSRVSDDAIRCLWANGLQMAVLSVDGFIDVNQGDESKASDGINWPRISD